MVYESDFYTNRRPYRPSAYSSTIHAVSSFYPSYGGSQRLMQSRVAPHRVVAIRVRPSVIIRELDRIEHKVRPSYGYSATEDFLSSNVSKTWEDESRKIRAQSASLMQQIQQSAPRKTIAPISTVMRYVEPALPFRLQSYENYVKNLVTPVRNVAKNILSMSWYAEPIKRFTGRGNLACTRYGGAKAYPTRRPLYRDDFSVRDDVTLLSFYVKNRLAAVGLALEGATAAPDKKEQPALVECSS